jgi:hypothetical protein
MTQSVDERLEAMEETFQNAEAARSGSAPDGDYEGLIERFDFWSKEGGPLKLITEISIQSGDHAGTSAPSLWHDLEDPDRIKWTKGYLEQLGLEGIKLSELKERLAPLAGKTRVGIRIATTTNKDTGKVYRNTYLNTVLEPREVDEAAEAAKKAFDGEDVSGQGDDGDIPF